MGWADGHLFNLLFPYMEMQALYDTLDFEVRPQYRKRDNILAMRAPIDAMFCPSHNYRGLTTRWGPGGPANIVHYYAVHGDDEFTLRAHPDGSTHNYNYCAAGNGAFYNDSEIGVKHITDGTSNTAIIAETWGSTEADGPGEPNGSRGMNLHSLVYFDVQPNSNQSNPWKPNSFHPGGIQVAMADGSVQFVQDGIDLDTFRLMATIAGEELEGDDLPNDRQP